MQSELEHITGKKNQIEKATFTIVPWSPVFFGSGNKYLAGLDFEKGKPETKIFNLTRIFERSSEDIDNLEKALLKRDLSTYLNNNNLLTKQFFRHSYTGKTLSNELMEPVTDGFARPIIPGSSIKGSIRTALFSYLFEKEPITVRDYLNKITLQGNRGKKHPGQDIERHYMVSSKAARPGENPNYDVGRVIRVSDATFDHKNIEVFNIAVLNETKEGFEWFIRKKKDYKTGAFRSINSSNVVEATKISVAGISFDEGITKPVNVTISLDHGTREKIGFKYPITFKKLAEACNKVSRKIIELDLEYVKDAMQDQQELVSVKNELEEMLTEIEAIEEENRQNSKVSWMQRIGWGSGYVTMTGAHTYTDGHKYMDEILKYHKLARHNMEFPKTRRIVLDLDSKPDTMMGWVLVEQA